MPLPPNAPPLPPEPSPEYGNWWPYENCVQFETSNILFTHDQLPAKKIDNLLNIWLPLWLPNMMHHYLKTMTIFTQQLMLCLCLGVMPTGSLSTSAFVLTRSSLTMLPTGTRPNGTYGIETPANSSTTCFKIQISATNLTTCLTKSMTLMVNITFIM